MAGPNDKIMLTSATATRIARAVRTVEGMATDLTGRSRGGKAPQPEIWIAQIVQLDPGVQPDFLDGRYWVRRLRASNTAGDTTAALTLEVFPEGDDRAELVVANNLAEIDWDAAGYLLRHRPNPGTFVVIWATRDRQQPAQKRYYFSCSIPRPPDSPCVWAYDPENGARWIVLEAGQGVYCRVVNGKLVVKKDYSRYHG